MHIIQPNFCWFQKAKPSNMFMLSCRVFQEHLANKSGSCPIITNYILYIPYIYNISHIYIHMLHIHISHIKKRHCCCSFIQEILSLSVGSSCCGTQLLVRSKSPSVSRDETWRSMAFQWNCPLGFSMGIFHGS